MAIVVVGLSLVGLNAYLGGGIVVVGAISFAATHPRLRRRTRLAEAWDYACIEAALRDAPPRSRIRILETWLPHVETLAPKLIDKDKDFTLQILLMHPGAPVASHDLLAARVEHRNDFNRSEARHNIIATINVLLNRQRQVEGEVDRTVGLQIRVYTFLPFGPFYDVGGHMVAGLYPSHTASESGPMFIVAPPGEGSRVEAGPREKSTWHLLDTHFQVGWSEATSISDLNLTTDADRL
ncbi:MAG: hypothetical protein WBV77_02110 [Solirubrobacteraceae bacterium]